MEDKHKKALTSNLVKLVDGLQVTDKLLACLEASDVLSDEMSEEIMLKGASKAKSRELIKILRKRGPQAFHLFLDALLTTKQTYLAVLLDEAYVKERYTEPMQDTHSPGKTMEQTLRDKQNEMQAFSVESVQESMEDMTLSDDGEDSYSIRYLTKEEFRRKSVGSHDVYRNGSFPRGQAVIINNVKFKKERKGSNKDKTMLQSLLKDLGYHVTIYRDLKKAEMCEAIKTESKKDHSEFDSFILAILSHGKDGIVYGIDAKPMFIKEDIRDVLSNRTCHTLNGKPKIIIIQACQGERRDMVDVDKTYEPRDVESPETLIDVTDALPDATSGNPAVADFVYAIATCSDYVSFRSEEKGSPFIRAINKVFCLHAHEWNIDQMFTKVNRVVGKRLAHVQEQSDAQGCSAIGYSKQAPQIIKTTGKQLYFFPYKQE